MSVTDVLLETAWNWAPNRVREVRGENIGRLVLEEGHGVDEVHRNRHSGSSLSADSGGQIRGLAASFLSGEKRGQREGIRGSYSVGYWWQLSARSERGSNAGDVTREGGETVRGERADRWVPRVSERKREGGIPVRDARVGRGPILMPGQMGSPGPFSIFIFFSSFPFLFFLFLL
jgi:hypothetical protein